MASISYEKFREIFDSLPAASEFEFYFDHTKETYMLIKYKDRVSFARCGYGDDMIANGLPVDYRGSEVFYYRDLEELYTAKSVDGICLKGKWNNITDILLNSTVSLLYDDIEEIEDFMD